jgi:hypothetical protein
VASDTSAGRYLDPKCASTPSIAAGSPLYVMAREDGRWLPTARQNTLAVAD